MPRIVNMADPDNSDLYPSLEAAEVALENSAKNWVNKGWRVVKNEDQENRYTVSNQFGEFVGEFYIDE